MPAYTITAVAPNPRDWNSTQGGPMKGYRVTMRDAQGQEMQNVEWSRKVTSAAPTVGQQVEGTIDTSGQYGPKFKAAQQGGGFGGGGFRPRDPAERKSIEMMHAQKCAVDALRLAAEHGEYKPPKASDVVDQVRDLAASFFAQIEEVAK